MAGLVVRTHVEAGQEACWRVLTDWEGYPSWMKGARQVEVLSREREGVGVRLRRLHRVFGFPLLDDLEVVEWAPPSRLVLERRGPILHGEARILTEATAYGTSLSWNEEVRPALPGYLRLPTSLLVAAALRLWRPLLASSVMALKARAEGIRAGEPGG